MPKALFALILVMEHYPNQQSGNLLETTMKHGKRSLRRIPGFEVFHSEG